MDKVEYKSRIREIYEDLKQLEEDTSCFIIDGLENDTVEEINRVVDEYKSSIEKEIDTWN
jgi:hypothetical protein